MMIDLKEFHEELLEILLEFDRICRKYQIRYSLAYGTLLGAVRHQGFIPWDDDVDVMIERNDFDRFCEVCPQELGSAYFFQSRKTEQKYPYNLVRIRKNQTAMIYNEWKNAGIHLGIYIDIYPIDHIPDNPFLRELQRLTMILSTPVRISANPVIFETGGQKFNPTAKKLLARAVRFCPRRLFAKLEDSQLRKYRSTPCRRFGVICEGGILIHTPRDLLPFDSSLMQEYCELPFEGHMLMAARGYRTLLEGWYGDYMQLPPEEQRVMYHQPDIFDTKHSYREYLEN